MQIDFFIPLTLILAAALAWLSVKDIRTHLLPDIVTLPLIALGLGQAALSGVFIQSLIGAAAGYVAFVAIEKGYLALRGRDGLGRGDAKLLAAAGAWCGWAALPFVVLIASLSGIALALAAMVATKDKANGAEAIAFGPHLAAGFFCVWIVTQKTTLLAAGV